MTRARLNPHGFLLDLDGVTWFGNVLAPGARDFWEQCRARRLPIAFVSNASAASRASIHTKLEALGLDGVVEDQIFPATRATALYMARKKPGARVYLVGEGGLAQEIEDAGCMLVADQADFVAVGIDRSITYARLERACLEVLAGAALVTTNGDGNFPTEHGLRPAAGPFAAFIAAATGHPATIIGKPQAELLLQAIRYLALSPGDVAMVGDRPEADVVAARRAGTQAVLVGDDATAPLVDELKPDLICRDLADLARILWAGD